MRKMQLQITGNMRDFFSAFPVMLTNYKLQGTGGKGDKSWNTIHIILGKMKP